ncbi:unnamed protein product [Dovyalis caffra]|uniref:Uncharacterized protein n=1 Tax=Dovyalis caffra TaxID=77055 RepID=A0AAV1REH2_9ROSI|nr:unnamed protein product [Dovyalis caffra]
MVRAYPWKLISLFEQAETAEVEDEDQTRKFYSNQIKYTTQTGMLRVNTKETSGNLFEYSPNAEGFEEDE